MGNANASFHGFLYLGENDTLRAGMSAEGIAYVDENRTLRASMDDEGIHYLDENGEVVWSTICAPNC